MPVRMADSRETLKGVQELELPPALVPALWERVWLFPTKVNTRLARDDASIPPCVYSGDMKARVHTETRV